MSEYINRQAVMQEFANRVRRSNNSDFAPTPTWNQAVQIVEDFPAADVAPVRHGRWELDVLDGTPGYRPVCLVCSECHRISYAGFPYCPNCGAHMTKGEQNG